jgi:transforming growth factor-beta-induced protein
MKKTTVFASILAVVLLAAAFAPSAAFAQEAEPSIVDIAVENEGFSTLVAAVQAAGLADTLAGEGPYTVFAPTNEAFAALFAELAPLGITPADLLANEELLTSVLLYHVAPGELYSPEVIATGTLTMADGNVATAYLDGGTAYINGARISNVDIHASNGVIHVIDEVILPPSVRALMAPAEFDASIVDIAAQNEGFSTLVAAAQAAGLVDTLAGEGPYTVFAPTNDAFEAALSDLGISAADLLADTDLLTAVLLYHVAPGEYFAGDVLAEGSLTMADGNTAEVAIEDGMVTIDGAPISNADINVSNGVIHVIDYVMLPPAE